MGREKRLMEYLRRLETMCHRTNKLPEADIYPDPAEKWNKALEKYGIPEQVYADKTVERNGMLPAAKDDEYYEKIINGKIPARTGFDKAIQAHTKKDAGLVLVMIGISHPASKTVYKYLVRQKRAEYGEKLPHSYLLFRESFT